MALSSDSTSAKSAVGRLGISLNGFVNRLRSCNNSLVCWFALASGTFGLFTIICSSAFVRNLFFVILNESLEFFGLHHEVFFSHLRRCVVLDNIFPITSRTPFLQYSISCLLSSTERTHWAQYWSYLFMSLLQSSQWILYKSVRYLVLSKADESCQCLICVSRNFRRSCMSVVECNRSAHSAQSSIVSPSCKSSTSFCRLRHCLHYNFFSIFIAFLRQ